MKMTQDKKVALVAGASGIIGQQLSQALVADQWQVTALTHQSDLAISGTEVIAVDLRDVQQSHERLASLTDVTHIFYSAWLNAADWESMVGPNLAMLQNLVQTLENIAPLEHVSLMQGYKVYGAHLGRFKTPARESDPGVPGAEFNAAQLNWLSAQQQGKAWHWSAPRPGVVGSDRSGNVMNLALSLAIYASICRAAQLPLRFPGSLETWNSMVDFTDAALLADATIWAARNADARNQAFNINNGDLWRWSELWPVIAEWFALDIAPPVSLSFRQMFREYRTLWRDIAADNTLVEADILALSDGTFADFVFGWNYDMFGDGSKLRRAGFNGYRATDEMFCDLFAHFRSSRMIP
ncbi:NAD-dependent dehydratase (plasmid) [Pantoea vagans]|uniref:SDR family oxidoreductase n=1 Tax=unclassified Pantoea TaxID=2630326 RepID=UPI0001E0B328|nr:MULTISPECIES: SDR family oxidoreductase [Pantoea]AWP34987.1 NAD-dependent dehydratase [Pantoea vagans]EFM21628.1 NAD-dependent epimerase/dehydratase [Pantoea sp. aB]QNQ60952.1 SDR family oxidoreductase [Pantoea sp. MT58]